MKFPSSSTFCAICLSMVACAVKADVVFQDPPILATPGAVVADGTTVTLNADVTTDSGQAIYQWLKDDAPLSNGSGVSGATSNKLVIKSAKPSNSGAYRIQVREFVLGGGLGDPEVSDSMDLMVHQRPLIVSQPVSQTKIQDAELMLSVGISPASEQTLQYEWQLNNVPIDSTANPSAATKDFIIPVRDAMDPDNVPGVQLTDAGSYRVKVTNLSGIAVFSKPALVKVNSAAAILVQPPAHFYIAAKAKGKLSVVAGGAPKLQFQWEIEGEGNVAKGGNAASITIPGVPESDGKKYRVTVTNGLTNAEHPADVSIWSEIHVINKLAAPVITGMVGATTFEKGAGVFDAGSDPTLTVQASLDNTGDLEYQWQKDGKNISDTVGMTGTNARNLVFDDIQWTARGTYRCIVKNQVGVVTSKTFKVEVNSPPVIITQPQMNVVGITGGKATMSVIAGGSGKLSYQWFKKTGGGAVPIAKATKNKLALSKLAKTDPAGEDYYCEIRNALTDTLGGGTPTTSDDSNLVVYDPVKIVTHPAPPPGGVRVTNNTTLTVGVTGDAPMLFEWWFGKQKLVNGMLGSATIAGADTGMLEINNIQSGLQGSYYCIVRNAKIPGVEKYLANVKSKAVKVNVIMPPTIVSDTQASPSLPVIEEDRVTLSIVGGGTPPLKYQWEKSAAADGPWIPIQGKTSPQLVYPKVALTDDAWYRCVVSNSLVDEPAESTGLELVVNPIPPSEITSFLPPVARASEKVRVFGSSMNYVKNVKLGSVPASFVIEGDDSILITVPNLAPLESVPEVNRLISLENKNHTTFSASGFARTTSYANNLPVNSTILIGSKASSQGDNTGFDLDLGGAYSGDNSTAWFWWKAPHTGNYRVRAACSFDSSLVVRLGTPTSPVLPLHQAVSFISWRTETMVMPAVKGQDYMIIVAGNSFAGFRAQGTFVVDLASTTVNVTDDEGDAMEVNGGEFSVGGNGEGGEDVVHSKLADYETMNGPIIRTTLNMAFDSESGEASDDGFGWALYGADDTALAGVWFNVLDGKVYVTDMNGSYTELDHKILINAPHHLEISVNRESGTWSLTLDDVLILPETELPSGSVFKDISAVWRPASGSASSVFMKVTDFKVSSHED